jgi:uncharacterized membrane protein YfcA
MLPAMDASALLFVALVFFLAGFVKGVVGLGLPTVAIGLLGLVMTPGEAAALLTIPAIVTNLWQLGTGPRFGALARRFRLLLAGICLGTLAGGIAFGQLAGPEARVVLGVALLLYAVLGLARLELRVPARLEPALSPVIGAATGLVTAATGVFVVPAVPYLQALELGKEDLIQALGLSFTISSLALGIMLAAQGTLGGGAAGTSLLALLPALAGMAFGQWARARISPGLFRLCFFLGMLVLGLDLAWR